jgi:hypothetical protein
LLRSRLGLSAALRLLLGLAGAVHAPPRRREHDGFAGLDLVRLVSFKYVQLSSSLSSDMLLVLLVLLLPPPTPLL